MRNDPFNIAQYLPAMAKTAPERAAIVCTHAPDELGRTSLTFAELDGESDRLAWGLRETGVQPGSLTLLMLRPGLNFLSLTFALFKLGAVPVLIDPGMGWTNVQNCVRQCRPENFIGIPLAHAVRAFTATDAFDSVRRHVTVGRRWFWGGVTLRAVRRMGNMGSDKPFPLAATTERSPAAVLFTSGGTGTPKGVLYEHGMFGAQVLAIRAQYGIQPGERDLPAFPLFGLFAPALGTTCVVPELNPSRPAQCDPAKIAKALQTHEITYTFGSPAIWRRVGPYCIEKGITFPNVRRILMAGAPVRAEVLEPFTKILPNGDTYIPYGATEALPIATIRGSEVLSETWALTRAGKGYCVGRPLPDVTVRVIACAPAVVESTQWDSAFVLPPGAIGEIVVKGPVVTCEYYNMPEQTRAAKIYENLPLRPPSLQWKGENDVWHRMGDMGYFDESGRLWLCGRKAHRVIISREKILFSVCVEAIFEAFLDDILKCGIRTALAGIGEPGRQTGVIVVEAPKHLSRRVFQRLVPNVEQWSATQPLARDVAGILLYRKPFPVDVRHNAKIDREKLGRWAAKLKTLDWTHAR